ncbi:hypothetical protein CEE39_03275 [bacterium (candidate division B38) B3_B38]|nr:MAG: hypothetical protein CEE39_03275 [bacterium (candidate division B38) B3_B38]
MRSKSIFSKLLFVPLLVLFTVLFFSLPILSQSKPSAQAVDEEYTRLIKEATTKPEFLSPLTSYLPRVEGVPTPKDVLGYIAGAPGKLTYYEDILKYMKALAKASPNVEVFPIGKTSEGREMVVVAIADSETMRNLQKYKDLMAKLADPRQVKTEQEAEAIIAQAKPIYWLTGNLHSGESGAAECSMELAYRLAVDDNPIVKKIRDSMIVLITPSVEPDGHDKHTDWFYKYNKDVTDSSKITRVPYWGRYTLHDNNRDMISISQPETQSEANNYFEWHPVVVQDNHESIPFLYVSSGTGPYNATYHPSTTSEWNLIAWWEVTRLTSFGMPGVWTHGFWDGWAPNYLFSVANNHNALGRFYETFGNSIGNTIERDLGERRFGPTSKQWYMPIPPYEKVLWSIRNNINYQQTADLQAFYFVATNKEYFLRNFWRRGSEAYKLGKNESPYAFVIPAGQKDPVDTAYLVNLLLRQRIEVHQATAPIGVEEGSFPAGSYVVRMDQPYRSLVVNLLGIQKYPQDAPRAYDDTGWTLGLHMDIKTVEIKDKAIFDAPVVPVNKPVKAKGEIVGGEAAAAYIINNGTINNLLSARIKLKDFKALAAEAPFEVEDKDFDAGSMIIPVSGASAKLHKVVQTVAQELSLEIVSCASLPEVKTHELDIPRIAIYHTWSSTQNDGWVRFAFDQLGIPYAMIHKDHLKKGNLKAKYDVIVFSNCGGRRGADIVNGMDPEFRGSLAFVKSKEFKHLGTPDSSEDITGGMGIEGVTKLQKFVEEGGLLIALQNPVRVPVDYGMVRGISIFDTSRDFYNPGSLLKAEVANCKHPIVYGFDKEIPLYRSHSGPLLRISSEAEKFVVVKYASEGEVCLSGIVKSPGEIKGKAAIVDVPVGKGHMVLFTFNPFWRDLSRGNYMFVFNAILNYNDLGVGLQE